MSIEREIREMDNPYQYNANKKGTVYTFDFPIQQVRAEVDELRVDSKVLKAEIKFTSYREVSRGFLGYTDLNLKASGSRKSFANDLKERDETVADWNQIVTSVSMYLIEDYKTGEEAVHLEGEIKEENRMHWLVEPLLGRDTINTIYAPGASGKSWLAIYLATLIQHGVMESDALHANEKKNVMILDWETNQKEFAGSYAQVRNGLKLPYSPLEENIVYKPMRASFSASITQISRVAMEKDIGLIIIVSIGAASGGSSEESQVILDLFNRMKVLELSILAIDHTNKSNVPGKNLFGSEYKYNESRVLWEIKPTQSLTYLDIVLHSRKSNNSQNLGSMALRVDFSPEAVFFSRKNISATSGGASQLSVPAGITDRLRERPHTVSQLATTLAVSEGQIRNAITDYNQDVEIGTKTGPKIINDKNTHMYKFDVPVEQHTMEEYEAHDDA